MSGYELIVRLVPPAVQFRLGSVFRKLVNQTVDFFVYAVGPTLDEGNFARDDLVGVAFVSLLD